MKKPALTPKQRLALLEKVYKGGKKAASVCREYGISRFTFYKWEKRYNPGLSRNKNLENLRDKKRIVKTYTGQISQEVEEEVKKIAAEFPNLSKYKIAEKAKARLGDKAPGIHGVYNVLRRAGIETSQKRKEWRRFVFQAKGRVLTPEQRLEIIKKATELNIPVAKVCRDFGISRQTFYKWKRRWEKVGNIDALRDRMPQYNRRHLRVRTELEKEILSIVIEAPNLSKYGIARKLAEKLGPVVSPHGVYNVLLRNGLNVPEKRLAYSVSLTPQVAVRLGWTDRIRYVLEQFVPTTAPAPPPALATTLNFLKTFSITSVISSATVYSIVWWIDYLASLVTTQAIGLVFATIALFMGSLFFIYSLKYYLTLALVLSFSQTEQGKRQDLPAGKAGVNGKRGGIINWLLGSGIPNTPVSGRDKAVGLTPNLEHISLKRRPYVSVQIPLFNEKRVVDRILKASTSFEYPEYEVILCDDSTDVTTDIIRKYQKEHLAKGQNLKTQNGQGWVLTSVEVKPGVTLKHLHRTSRSGYKGGALSLALSLTDPRAEFISVFDADFVPYPDTLELFLKYFQATAGTLDLRKSRMTNDQWSMAKKKDIKHQSSTINHQIAAVQGYQWHVLNKSENWITRGVRSEYAGSYVIERSGTEIYSGLKQISGAVYMIRKDVLEEVGWETSITEDFQLTLKLYEKGYKVVYTPYIQAPAECVSTLKRLIRQRMRWAEGHSNNIRRMFIRLMFGKWLMVNGKREFTKSPLTRPEKLEFLYLSPYYLQAFFFLVGTISWLISETVFQAGLPFWTSLWGWSLVLTNLISLPLMNAVGLFLEESEERDYQGIISFVALTYIVVPFQAYAAIKGFLQKEEGPWFRTPKTGRITDVFARGRFYRFISGILPGRAAPAVARISARQPSFSANQYVALATANNQFNSFAIRPKKKRWVGNLGLVSVSILSTMLLIAAPLMPLVSTPVSASPIGFKGVEVAASLEEHEVTQKEITSPVNLNFQGVVENIEYIFHPEPRVRVKLGHKEVEITTLEIPGLGKAEPQRAIIYGSNRVVYQDIFENIDLEYKMLNSGFEENFILKARLEIGEVVQRVKVTDLNVVSLSGDIAFFDKERNKVVSFRQANMYELSSPSQNTKDMQMTLEKESIGYQLKKTLTPGARAWLADPNRVFPVVLDPGVIITSNVIISEVEYAGNQRKLYYHAAFNKYYAISEASDVLYNYCDADVNDCNSGTTNWSANIELDTGDSDNLHPNLWFDGTVIWVVWGDNSCDCIEFRSITPVDGQTDDTLGTNTCFTGDILDKNGNFANNLVGLTVAGDGTTGYVWEDRDTVGGNDIQTFTMPAASCASNPTFTNVDASVGGLTNDGRYVAVPNDGSTAAVTFFWQDSAGSTGIQANELVSTTWTGEFTIEAVEGDSFSVTKDSGHDIWILHADSGGTVANLYQCAGDGTAQCDAAGDVTIHSDPWTGATNLSHATVTYASTANDLKLSVISDTSEQAYMKRWDIATTSLEGYTAGGAGDSYGFVAGTLDEISSMYELADISKAGVVLREVSATIGRFTYATVPENLIYLLALAPLVVLWSKKLALSKGGSRYVRK